jgi:hypothetical protein
VLPDLPQGSALWRCLYQFDQAVQEGAALRVLGRRPAVSLRSAWGLAGPPVSVPVQTVHVVTGAYVCRLPPLTCLAPDLVQAILDGRQPKGLRLAEMLGNGPVGWRSSADP